MMEFLQSLAIIMVGIGLLINMLAIGRMHRAVHDLTVMTMATTLFVMRYRREQ